MPHPLCDLSAKVFCSFPTDPRKFSPSKISRYTVLVDTIKLFYKKTLLLMIQILKYYKNVKTRCFSESSHRSEISSASDGLYISTTLTSADLVGRGLTCWSHSFSISRRQLSGTPLHRVSIAVRRPCLSDSIVPMFIHWLLIGSKILSIAGRVGRLSDMVFAAEAPLDEPCALPPPPSITIIILL